MLAIIYKEHVTPESAHIVTKISLPVKSMGWTMITVRMLGEVHLMIGLGLQPSTRTRDFGDNFLALRSEMFSLDLFRDTLGRCSLVVRGCEDG